MLLKQYPYKLGFILLKGSNFFLSVNIDYCCYWNLQAKPSIQKRNWFQRMGQERSRKNTGLKKLMYCTQVHIQQPGIHACCISCPKHAQHPEYYSYCCVLPNYDTVLQVVAKELHWIFIATNIFRNALQPNKLSLSKEKREKVLPSFQSSLYTLVTLCCECYSTQNS